MWQNIILKKSSGFKTLFAWYQRWSRPTSEKSKAFNDIWLTVEELKDKYALNTLENSIIELKQRLLGYYDEEVSENLTNKAYFTLYNNLRDRDKRMVDRIAKNIWDSKVSKLKRSNYGYRMQTPGTLRRGLKRIIPDSLLEKFNDTEIKQLEKIFNTQNMFKRRIKIIIEELNEGDMYQDFDEEDAYIEIKRQIQGYGGSLSDLFDY